MCLGYLLGLVSEEDSRLFNGFRTEINDTVFFL